MMNPEHWLKLDTLFQTAIGLEDGRRAAYLDENCSDPEIRSEVDRLLLYDRKNNGHLRQDIFNEAARLLTAVRIGEKLGAYTIQFEIGHGGMGIVYLASRSDDTFNKTVAIKILHSRIASFEEQQRFKVERQILASMEHANIARLIDGGACQDGSPYLVMEYVEGSSIDVYCEQHKLPLKQRIELFLLIGDAIQYAHRHRVLHCDIKPGNILVTKEGIPKLVDFGISRLLSSSEQEKMVENHSAQNLALTPAYASPEQLTGESLSESSDVYTLALVLFEIINGHYPPFDENKAFLKPDKIGKKLDSDLLAILSRALSKDQPSRYPSVSSLVDDLDNYLNHKPVMARHSTTFYSLIKFTQRKPALIVTALLLILLGLLASYNLYDVYNSSSPQTGRFSQAYPVDDHLLKTLSIAVLPFSSNNDQQLANGITEDLINDLSKVKKFNVIANNSIKQYTPPLSNINEITQVLNSSHMIQGDINLNENDISIKIKIIDSTTQEELWQRSYQRAVTELFDLQKLISANIVETFNISLSESESRLMSKRYTSSLKAYDYFLQGLSHYGKRFIQANRLAREHIEKAIALDENFARAYAVLANTHRADYINLWSAYPDKSINLAHKFVDRALAIDPDLAQAHFVKGLIQREQKQHSAAMASAANAIALNPSYADAFLLLASVLCYANSPDNSMGLIDKAVRLNPNHPINYKFHLGQCQYMSGRYEEAILTFEQAIERNPASQRSNLWLAVSYIRVGRIQDANWITEELLGWNPDLTIRHVMAVTPLSHTDDLMLFQQALVEAGLPE